MSLAQAIREVLQGKAAPLPTRQLALELRIAPRPSICELVRQLNHDLQRGRVSYHLGRGWSVAKSEGGRTDSRRRALKINDAGRKGA